MIYIHAAATYSPLPENRPPDLKAELKKLTGKSYRRIDRFIQLALLGAHQAATGSKLDPETAIYMTSGQGDIPVFERVRHQRYFQKMLSKPVDFVNLGGNIAGFYVASHLKLTGTNLFLSHKHFPVQMALLLAQSELELKREPAILLGGVDERLVNRELAQKLLGVNESTQLGEGSSWMLLRGEPRGAQAALSQSSRTFDPARLKVEISTFEPGTYISFSQRVPAALIPKFVNAGKDLQYWADESSVAYYETRALSVINHFLSRHQETDSAKLVHIDYDGDRFMLTSVLLLCGDRF